MIADNKQNDQWRANLEACQRRVLAVDGRQGGGLASVLKHLSFAKQRFESFVAPRGKFICMLQAIAMLPRGLAGDPRQPRPVRERAETALDAMTPADILACGLAADWGEVGLSSLRQFDAGAHDVAKSWPNSAKFGQSLSTLANICRN